MIKMAQVAPGEPAGAGRAHASLPATIGVQPPKRRRSAAENFKGNRHEKFCAAVAGAMAGGVGVLVGQPFDMLKVGGLYRIKTTKITRDRINDDLCVVVGEKEMNVGCPTRSHWNWLGRISSAMKS